jgi:hypothetical protein
VILTPAPKPYIGGGGGGNDGGSNGSPNREWPEPAAGRCRRRERATNTIAPPVTKAINPNVVEVGSTEVPTRGTEVTGGRGWVGGGGTEVPGVFGPGVVVGVFGPGAEVGVVGVVGPGVVVVVGWLGSTPPMPPWLKHNCWRSTSESWSPSSRWPAHR